MAEGIVSSFGGKVAEQWITQLFTPAFAFWAGGAALWCARDDHWFYVRHELRSVSESSLAVMAVAGLLVIALSEKIAQKFEPGIIGFLEGHWWPEIFRAWRVRRAGQRFDEAMATYEAILPKQIAGTATAKEQRRLAAASETLQRIPADPRERMPTLLGNILRSSERVSDWRYGLNATVCWARLWVLLPDGAKKDLGDARSDLGAGARAWFWGTLFLIWSYVSLWAILISIVACAGAYLWMKDAARIYGDLIQATFDVHRPALYRALRRDMAKNAAEEINLGKALSSYLANGSDDAAFVFSAPPANAP